MTGNQFAAQSPFTGGGLSEAEVNALIEAYAARLDIYIDDPDANALLVGNGSNPLQLIAPGTVNQVLVSNGTQWQAGAVPAPDLSSPGNIGGTTPGTGTFGASDSGTNTVLYPVKVRRTTAGSPANNIGVGVEFEVQATAGNRLAGRIRARHTAVATPVSDMIFDVYNGTTPVAALTLTPDRVTVTENLWMKYLGGSGIQSIYFPGDLGSGTLVHENANGNFTISGYVLRLYGTAGFDARSLGNNSMTFRTNNVIRASFDGSGNLVINDTGTDSDVRIEGDTDQNLFVLDAGLDAISIGEAAISGFKLNVNGTIRANGLRLDLTPTMESLTPTHSITISIDGTNYKIPLQAA